jgi:hypothetical protein
MPTIPEFTDALRFSEDENYPRLRVLLTKRGIDPSTTWLVDLFEDDVNFEFGIVLTGDRRVFQLGYTYPEGHIEEGELTEWVELTHSWRLTPYSPEIREAFDHLQASG